MSIISAFLSHQIWLQRNATSEVNQLAPFIEQMRQEAKKQVLAFGDESRTKAKLSAMLKGLTETLYALGMSFEREGVKLDVAAGMAALEQGLAGETDYIVD